ncbi:ATP-binding cassette domain-containing protein [Rhizobacter sp. LjRoot28]|uniref:ATP-binding cassette domain-containing protein n=1 Tax=Rhizobacter sp. LjRoot28 TaxID=3342309 RepID=UPI003ECDD06D
MLTVPRALGPAALRQPETPSPRAPAASPADADRRAAPASATRGVALHLSGVAKRYGARPVLDDIHLDVTPGEFIAVVGRSGCGKSTLLRLVAGLEQADGGQILLDGRPRAAAGDAIRIMFQDARLLPWKRVLDNVALGLTGPDVLGRAREALAQVGLAERADEWPAVLSGGQRQRVALARALVHRPRLLLLDEPLGALDALTRIEMQQLIESLWREHGFTALLVTHDVGEAVALADRVLLIEGQEVALDQAVTLPRPRARGQAALAAVEEQILQRVLHNPAGDEPPPAAPDWPAPHAWRWAV